MWARRDNTCTGRVRNRLLFCVLPLEYVPRYMYKERYWYGSYEYTADGTHTAHLPPRRLVRLKQDTKSTVCLAGPIPYVHCTVWPYIHVLLCNSSTVLYVVCMYQYKIPQAWGIASVQGSVGGWGRSHRYCTSTVPVCTGIIHKIIICRDYSMRFRRPRCDHDGDRRLLQLLLLLRPSYLIGTLLLDR